MKIIKYIEIILSNYVVGFLSLAILFTFVFCDNLSTLASILIGSYMTWLVSRAYYLKAGKELMEESAKIRNTLNIVALKLQDSDTYNLNLNDNGEVRATAEMSVSMSGHSKLTENLLSLEKDRSKN